MKEPFTCNLCQENRYRFIPFRYQFKGRHIYAAQCRGCGLIALHPRPTDDEIREMYSDEYFTVDDVQTHHYTEDYLTAVQRVDYDAKVKELTPYLPEHGTVLEVGCATGELLYALKNAGHSVTGVEISQFAARRAVESYDLTVIVAPFEKEQTGDTLQPASFDLILMGDVLEHFTDPLKAMKFAHSLLKQNGTLIVHVPSTLNLISTRIAFLLYRLIRTQKTMTIPPYHLTEFFPATLRKSFMAAGFSKCRIIQETKHPKTITLRHSRLENFVKVALQYPNYLLTGTLGIYGDRLTGIGRK
jgi:2-polyprenyl-3-methyl-5-hydroxy-6-metoxy-1,4-benzoquinol methylase